MIKFMVIEVSLNWLCCSDFREKMQFASSKGKKGEEKIVGLDFKFAAAGDWNYFLLHLIAK